MWIDAGRIGERGFQTLYSIRESFFMADVMHCLMKVDRAIKVSSHKQPSSWWSKQELQTLIDGAT